MTHGPGSMSLMTGSRRPLATSPGNVPPRGHGLVLPMDDEELSTTDPNLLDAANEREPEEGGMEERPKQELEVEVRDGRANQAAQ